MKKIAKLNNITSIPEFYNEMVLVYSSNTLFFLSEQTGEIVHKICFDDTWHSLEVLDGKLLMHKNDLFIYDDETKDFIVYQNSIDGGAISIYNDKIIENKYDRATNSVQVTLYDKSNKKLWQNFFPNRRGKYIWGEYLYVSDLSHRYIDFIDVHTGNVVNTLHFENPPISRFIYHYEDTLIVSLETKPLEKYCLLGLDARTGEEKWRIENAFDIYAQDNATGLFYALSGYFYQVIDVKNGKVICEDDLSAEMSKFNVIPEAGGCLAEDGIYFRGRMSAKFGLLNIHTHKSEFVEDLGTEKDVWTTDIQYHNGKVYVEDSMDVLHIWGKE